MTAILLLLAGSTCAAALGCRDTLTVREAAICKDDKLAALDGDVTRRYVAELAELSAENAEFIRQDQHAWLGWLDRVCPAHPVKHDTQLFECLTTHIKDRADGLSITKIADVTLFSRCYFAYAAEKPQDVAALHDPGFGEGAFCWPQIDKPNQKQEEFNAAAMALVLRVSSQPRSEPASDFGQLNVTGSEQSVDYSVVAANGRAVEIAVHGIFFGYGAAHPLSMDRTLYWWLDAGRELGASDIFQPTPKWKTILASRIVANLKANEDYKQYLEVGIEPTVSKKIGSTRSWTVSNEGWSLCFDQYEIGAYVMGMPCATFSWDELTPLLNPQLKPETLPALKHDP